MEFEIQEDLFLSPVQELNRLVAGGREQLKPHLVDEHMVAQEIDKLGHAPHVVHVQGNDEPFPGISYTKRSSGVAGAQIPSSVLRHPTSSATLPIPFARQ